MQIRQHGRNGWPRPARPTAPLNNAEYQQKAKPQFIFAFCCYKVVLQKGCNKSCYKSAKVLLLRKQNRQVFLFWMSSHCGKRLNDDGKDNRQQGFERNCLLAAVTSEWLYLRPVIRHGGYLSSFVCALMEDKTKAFGGYPVR
jgi:hypothetical protein